MWYLFLLFSLSSFISTEKQLLSRQYKSPDSATGGFEEIYLLLEKEGGLRLLDSVAVWKGATKSGGLYEWQLDTLISGNWEFKRDSIFCHFKADNGYLASLFISNRPVTKGLILRETTIIFTEQMDTFYIRNIPCVSE